MNLLVGERSLVTLHLSPLPSVCHHWSYLIRFTEGCAVLCAVGIFLLTPAMRLTRALIFDFWSWVFVNWNWPHSGAKERLWVFTKMIRNHPLRMYSKFHANVASSHLVSMNDASYFKKQSQQQVKSMATTNKWLYIALIHKWF